MPAHACDSLAACTHIAQHTVGVDSRHSFACHIFLLADGQMTGRPVGSGVQSACMLFATHALALGSTKGRATDAKKLDSLLKPVSSLPSYRLFSKWTSCSMRWKT